MQSPYATSNNKAKTINRQSTWRPRPGNPIAASQTHQSKTRPGPQSPNWLFQANLLGVPDDQSFLHWWRSPVCSSSSCLFLVKGFRLIDREDGPEHSADRLVKLRQVSHYVSRSFSKFNIPLLKGRKHVHGLVPQGHEILMRSHLLLRQFRCFWMRPL